MRAWTLEDVQIANGLDAEDWAYWIQQKNKAGLFTKYRRMPAVFFLPWDWITYVQRLCWTYVEAGALERLNGQMARAA